MNFCVLLSVYVIHQPFSEDLLTVFRDLIQSKIALAYMDESIIPSIDYDTRMKNFQLVLNYIINYVYILLIMYIYY